ncbi:hypothetical protein TW81_11620 [Vibrio galatheae]|uniref:Oxidoreductase molybdopterin-binding domain-containing protein n=1 Tax=Vibrio galatheae TaxID=579748 RepID=A0A0F4NJ54_9VIBR|nr:molybdopterin-dependent oxidoreductase [Vibrio galatheae]KJY82853.1 hypothetical protein TW81_11620 [Vibrio galatheae]
MRWSLVLVSLLICLQTQASQLVIRVDNQQAAVFSDNDIATQFSPTSFSTHLPWYPDKNKFTGFKVTDLLRHLKINDALSVSFVALNDYAASSQIADIVKYEPIIAYQMNDKNMKIRNKGPYWLVFNLDRNPEINNAAFHSQMVWQIDEILVHRKANAK